MQQQSRVAQPTRKRTRRRRDETARNNIVSVRVSDQDRQVLERITASTSRNVSDLVREAIDFWLTNNRKHLCANRQQRSTK